MQLGRAAGESAKQRSWPWMLGEWLAYWLEHFAAPWFRYRRVDACRPVSAVRPPGHSP
ncbi:protein of unknown function [Streptomyces murinus]